MSNTLALIALFIVGSADGQCVDSDTDGRVCKFGDTDANVIGTCSGNTCIAIACLGDAACGGASDNLGKCASAQCIYAPTMGKCDLFSATDMLCKTDTNEVGKCNGATCTRSTECDAKDTSNTDACGENDAGNCLNKKCTYTAPTVGMCGAFSPATRVCKSSNMIGNCNGSSCVTTCSGGNACGGSGSDLGKCNGSNCMYTPTMGKCDLFSAANMLCKSNNVVGGCDTTTRTTCKPATCSAGGSEACGTGSAGQCDGAGVCKYTAPAMGTCDLFSAVNMLCKTGNEVGKCNSATCTRSTECDAKDTSNTDACGENDAGACKNKKCTYTAPTTVGMCGAFSAADRLCKSAADVIGTCSGTTCTAAACSGTGTCGKGDAGKCAGGTCTYTTPAGTCDVFSATGMLCKSTGDVVGKCNGTTCAPANCATSSSAKCGENDVGKCDGKTNATCKYTTPAEGKCGAFSAGDYCKGGSGDAFIGMCQATSTGVTTCSTDAHCKGKKKDHPCGDGNTFKGECTTDNGTCKAIPPGQCHASAATGDYCRNDTYIGMCNNAATKMCMPTTGEGTPCHAKKRNDSCGDGNSWKGRCSADNGPCMYRPPEQCHASGDYCKIGNLIGKCSDASPTMCMTAGRCTGLAANEACGDGDTFKGQCMGGTCLYIASGQCDANAAPGSYCRNNPLIGKCTSASLPMCDTSEHDCASPPSNNKCGHQTIGTLKGTCDDGKCVAGKSLTVNYTIKVPVGDPNNIGTEAGKDTVEATFQTQIGLPVQHLGGACDMASESAPANGTLTGCSEFPGTNTCKLNCNAGYHIKKKHTRKCTADGMWVGQVGVCAKRCPVTQGTLANGQFTFDTSFSQAPTQGKLICTDVFPHATCSLKCNDTYHKVNENIEKYYRCSDDATPVWKYTTPVTGDPKLACVETALRRQSTRLVLEPGASVDADFMEKFTESIANTFGPTVLASHVSIVGIKVVDSGRRLNDSGRRLIQVDYTILVAKGEEEGATEVDKVDGTRSPEGDGPVGGLRGIR